jgi:MAX-like protein X
MAVSSINNPKQSSNQAPSTSSGIYHTPTLSPESAFENSHHEMSSSMSPERCLSLSKYHPRENQRRAGHIHAEQKRRYNIKNGFDMLHQLIPQLQQNPNAKVCLNTFETLKKLKKIYHSNS